MVKKIIMLFIGVFLLINANLDAYAFWKNNNSSSKFINKFEIILEASEQLKLSDAQIDKIEDEKISAQKALIMANANIESIALDIKVQLNKDKINMKTINKLIEEKYELKKNKNKRQVGAYARIKDILSKEQNKMLPEIFKGCRENGKAAMLKKYGQGRCPYESSGKKGRMAK